MVREIWFEKVIDQKKRWFYTINQPFFWFEKSGWPQKKIRVCRTTFLETLFYTFLEKWLQNKWSFVSIQSKLLNEINMPFLWKLQHLTLSVLQRFVIVFLLLNEENSVRNECFHLYPSKDCNHRGLGNLERPSPFLSKGSLLYFPLNDTLLYTQNQQ